MRLVTATVLAAVFLLAGGCGARMEYRADHLVAEQSSWDSLLVDVSFLRRTAIGGDAAVVPDTVVVTLFDEAYETLYEGAAGRIPVPDGRLGDRERLTVEACGIVRSRQICVQDRLRASPKRLRVDEEIDYPVGSDLAEGRYAFDFAVERQVFGMDAWEPIEAEVIEGHVEAWVNHRDARERGIVRFPFAGRQGSFDLSRQDNYKNFRYYLESELLDEERADVTFEVYAGLGGQPQRLASVTKEVQQKTDDDRANDVRYFVEQATERIIDELSSFFGGRRAAAYVDEWEYNRLSRTYVVRMEAEWEGSVFSRGEYEIAGELEVGEDGRGAVFRIRSGNRRAVNRWRDRVDDDTMPLGTLETLRTDDPVGTF